MDDLERGPLPISVRPLSQKHPISDDSDGERVKKHSAARSVRSRSIHTVLNQKPTVTRQQRDETDDEEEEEDEEEGVMAKSLTAELRSFAERIVGLENKKMEMMKETERFRLEMENKRIRMILESQWRIVDSIGKAFGSS